MLTPLKAKAGGGGQGRSKSPGREHPQQTSLLLGSVSQPQQCTVWPFRLTVRGPRGPRRAPAGTGAHLYLLCVDTAPREQDCAWWRTVPSDGNGGPGRIGPRPTRGSADPGRAQGRIPACVLPLHAHWHGRCSAGGPVDPCRVGSRPQHGQRAVYTPTPFLFPPAVPLKADPGHRARDRAGHEADVPAEMGMCTWASQRVRRDTCSGQGGRCHTCRPARRASWRLRSDGACAS